MMKKMTEFEFQLFCRDVTTDDESFLDSLYEAGCDDAIVSFKDGYLCLDFSRQAESAEDAVVSAIRDFKRSEIGGTIERVEPEDLASLAEIANRVGVTRASLQKYARGDSKVGKDFPRPAANISQPRRAFYSASEVINWMFLKKRVDLSEHFVELATVIKKSNQALLVTKARNDEGISRLVSQLTAIKTRKKNPPKSPF